MSGLLLYVSDVSPYRSPDGHYTVAGVHQSLGSAARAFEEISLLCGLEYCEVVRARDATAELLAQARVLVLFTIGETPWSVEQRRLIEERVASGDLGLVGVHAATDSAYEWPAFGDLIGARFDGHPVTGELPIHVVDRDHPATAHLPNPWRFKEELYLFRALSHDARILLDVEFGTQPAQGGGVTLPISWCIERGPMRSFYTVLGHFVAAYEDGAYVQHLRGAVEWILLSAPL
jgi:type 1 glutamine amidotransferase